MKCIIAIFCIIFCSIFSSLVFAGIIDVEPIRIKLSAKQMQDSLTISNNSDENFVLQVHPMQWTQAAGKDIYSPTTHLLLTPPIILVKAHGKQTLRLALRQPPSADHELTYRIYLQQLPHKNVEGLQLTMRFGVPLFVAPTGPIKKNLIWSASNHNGVLAIKLNNQSNVHIQVNKLFLKIAGKKASEVVSSYVLPGQILQWSLKSGKLAPLSNETVHLVADTDWGDISADVSVKSS
ncbi:molecular chaperone [soil metagenome]